MTFLPIVERELRVVARMPATYRNRVFIAGAVIGVAMIMLLVGFFSNSPSQIGRSMFWTLSYMAVAFCIFEGARKTADCVSEEKREGTLGLLFLTDLKGYDVILGKLTAKSSNSVYGLISVLPVLALSLILGGVTAGQYWREVLALLNLLFFSLCVGLWVSCWSRDEQQAMTRTFLFVAACIGIPLLSHLKSVLPLSPVYAVPMAAHANYLAGPERYWQSIGATQAFSWGLLLWAMLVVPRCWREKPPRYSAKNSRISVQPKNAEPRNRHRARLLEINPVLWLSARDLNQVKPWMRLAVFACMGVVAFIVWKMKSNFLLPYIVGCMVLNFALKMRVAARSCHCLAEARRNNALEMLLVTPLSTEEILRGQVLGLKQIFFWPIIRILAVEIIGLVLMFLLNSEDLLGRRSGANTFGLLMVSLFLLLYLGLFILDIFAVIWAGMWNGLTAKNEGRAVTKTIWLVLVLPFLCMFLSCGYGSPFGLTLPVIFLANARGKLLRELRFRAAMAYQPSAQSEASAGLLISDLPQI